MPYLTLLGTRLFYDQAGNGTPPLVFVHGIVSAHDDWHAQVDSFRPRQRVRSAPVRASLGSAPTLQALAVLAGGNVRVGLEDNLWLGRGQLATNGALVERAATIVTNMGARLLGPDEVRAKLKLVKRD